MKLPAVLLCLAAALAPAQDTQTPEGAARAGAWKAAVAFVSQIEKNDTGDFPGLRGWLKDFHAVLDKVGDGDAAGPFRTVDSDALVTRNANWWAACQETVKSQRQVFFWVTVQVPVPKGKDRMIFGGQK